MSEKIIRDSVHDVIALRTDCPEDALLFALLQTHEVQRLRRIRQLGMASLAYPGADHSRYSHSIGVMETARRMLARLADHIQLDPRQRLICVVAALLHDLGHGPFSHVFERVSGTHHEELTRRLVAEEESGVHQTLARFDAQLPTEVLAFLDKQNRTFYHDIISSQLDADRFDYLLRDNLMTGSRYGQFDLAWLIQALTVDITSRLAVQAKGLSAVEAYLQARYHMYRNVYFHKVVRSAEGMVKLALQRARRLAVQDRLAWPPREHPVHKALLGQALSAAEFLDLDDVSILHCFKTWEKGDDPTLAHLCRGLLYRRLFKVIDLSALDLEAARDSVADAEAVLIQRGYDPAYDLFVDEPANTPYSPLTPAGAPQAADSDDGIRVVDKTGHVSDLAQASPMVLALNRQLMFRRLHVREDLRDLVKRAMGV